MEEVPPLDRPEWKSILEGKHEFSAFAPRLLVDRVKKNYESGSSSEQECIVELHAFFLKYKKAYKADLQTIFKQW